MQQGTPGLKGKSTCPKVKPCTNPSLNESKEKKLPEEKDCKEGAMFQGLRREAKKFWFLLIFLVLENWLQAILKYKFNYIAWQSRKVIAESVTMGIYYLLYVCFHCCELTWSPKGENTTQLLALHSATCLKCFLFLCWNRKNALLMHSVDDATKFIFTNNFTEEHFFEGWKRIFTIKFCFIFLVYIVKLEKQISWKAMLMDILLPVFLLINFFTIMEL